MNCHPGKGEHKAKRHDEQATRPPLKAAVMTMKAAMTTLAGRITKRTVLIAQIKSHDPLRTQGESCSQKLFKRSSGYR
jgi:hypothetical protein